MELVSHGDRSQQNNPILQPSSSNEDEDFNENDLDNSTKRRCSDNTHLFSLHKPNIFPEKRQSEPTITYAFYNKSFDIPTPSKTTKRFHSISDVNQKVLQKQFSTIQELSFDEDSSGMDWKKMNIGSSKFKCFIDLDPIKVHHEITDSDIFRDALVFQENFVKKSEQFGKTTKNCDDDYYDDKIIYENVKFCKKCGHQSVKL